MRSPFSATLGLDDVLAIEVEADDFVCLSETRCEFDPGRTVSSPGRSARIDPGPKTPNRPRPLH